MSEPYFIGQLAGLAGVRTDTIRFYEKKGLLPEPTRSASGYRVYNEAGLKQLRFIKKAQSLGFTLDEIKRVLGLWGEGKETCRCVIAIAEATLADTDEKLREIKAFRDALNANLTRWKAVANQGANVGAEFCALIESVGEREKPD